MALAAAYDPLNTAIFLSSGGSRRVRQSLVDALDVRPGHRVLELGCGTGQVTARLLAAGAEVVAVDALSAMLVGARRRAAGATFVQGNALEIDVGGGYDCAVLSFVLHNFEPDGRARLLGRTATAIMTGGRIGVLDWMMPPGRIRGALWRRFIRVLGEPTAQQLLDSALETEIPAAGLRIEDCRRVAGGRVQIFVVSRLNEMWDAPDGSAAAR